MSSHTLLYTLAFSKFLKIQPTVIFYNNSVAALMNAYKSMRPSAVFFPYGMKRGLPQHSFSSLVKERIR
ncbi:MAG TPA: hypothetical protein DCZ83_00750 [Candidatus Yonathbacteria bacterium]|nr:hypothetical protein [Candidatus Yonathbacteria bacterium]